MSEAVFEFTASGFHPVPENEASSVTTLVSDSWLVNEGRVVAWEKHQQRFLDSVLRATSFSADMLSDFLHDVHARNPPSGRWFPRIEAVTDSGRARLRYRHRTAPEPQSTAVLARAPHDPRTQPLVKGPDLEDLLALREAVAPSGATEAIIVDSQDRLAEGAYSTLLVWPADGDHLVVIAPEIARLPSVTETVLTETAEAQGVEVRPHVLRVADLEDAEVWVVSALHGIRLATDFVEGPRLNTTPDRSARWQQFWRDRAQHPTLT